MKKLLHLSDLHFGRVDDSLVEPLRRAAQAIAPDLVVISGDFTQRARRVEYRAARRFLDSLSSPRLVVPGNHDIPLWDVIRRFVSPLGRYRHYITDDLAPFYVDDEIAVLGINTARSLTRKYGRINARQMARAREVFAEADPAFDVTSAEVHRARDDSWYAETPYGWAILRYDQGTAILKDRRFQQGNARWPAQNGIHDRRPIGAPAVIRRIRADDDRRAGPRAVHHR